MMKKQNKLKVATIMVFAVATVTISGCSKDDDNPAPVPVLTAFSGSHESIENYVTPQLLQTMEDLGLQINEGAAPPDISGEFLDAPNILQSTNIASDTPGSTYADTYFKFQNQNTSLNTIDISYRTPGDTETASGIGTVISGHDNYFTVIAKQKTVHPSGSADGILIVSGKLTDTGIEDFQFAIFMLDNHGDNSFIANQKGRVFHDNDNVAIKQ